MRPTPLLRAIVALALPAVALAQDSESYVVRGASASVVAARASFPTYDTTIVVEPALSGAASACNQGFISSVGALSALGTLPVPNVLRVDKEVSDPAVIQLSWSGAADGFEVFRSSSPQDVVALPT